ncbi:hypothetical protein BDF20DRAFT_998625 [Mycotypha africana]|uniref:uncharacterized protein n=1 Tax=Mycotypha africana TaxID=64632 RepID=UPI002300E9B4|nr:uncharacterized protein BDF20DRAFT_998625 [Mycotypha africana]KAI8988114.1 hypothetical protein BDF20DRAFT_998625 [Mycotypha africana]
MLLYTTNITDLLQTVAFSIGLLLITIPTIHWLLIRLQNEQDPSPSKTFMRSLSRLYRFLRYITPIGSSIEAENVAAIVDQFQLRSTTSSNAANPSVTGKNETLVTTELIDEVCLLPGIEKEVTKKDTEHSTATMVAGLANTGNSCFLNSVLQSLSSLPTLQAYLHQFSRSTAATASIPITRSLLITLLTLTKPSPRNKFFRPKEMVTALSINNDIINREQQDAQELYQLLMNELDTEISSVRKGQQPWKRGFKDILNVMAHHPSSSQKAKLKKQQQQQDDFIHLENPLHGLLAYKMTCTQCGSMSGIPLQLFNNVQLALPNNKDHTSLNDCLEQLTSVEYLQDVECEQCTLQSLRRKQHGKNTSLDTADTTATTLTPTTTTTTAPTATIKTEKSKQAMFVKPPKILCLHFVRSMYVSTGEILKNTCKVDFPEVLDLTRYCNTTSHPNDTISNAITVAAVTDSKTPTHTTMKLPLTPPPTPPIARNYTYRLMSMIVHYGDHSSGHYIAYKRRIVANTCSCKICRQEKLTLKPSTGSEWYKMSDDNVRACPIDEVLSENPFMLMYELVEQPEKEENSENETTVCGKSLSSTTALDTTLLHQQQQQQQQPAAEEVADLLTHDSASSSSSSDDEDEDDDFYHFTLPAAPPSSPLLRPIMKQPNPLLQQSTPAHHHLTTTVNKCDVVHRKKRVSINSNTNISLTECRSIPIVI